MIRSATLTFILLIGSMISLSGCLRNTPQKTQTPTLSTGYEIRAEDSGKTFTYNVTTRFTVILDADLYPKDELEIHPEGIIGSISNIPAVQPPFYAARFETVQSGECTMRDRDFQVTILVVE